MFRTCGPTATTSAHASRFDTCAVAGMRMPARDLRSPSVSGSCTSTRSLSILTGCFWSRTAICLRPYRSHGDPAPGQVLLGLPDRVLAEVEDRRRQHGVGTPLERALGEVLEATDAPAGDHRDAHGVAHRPGQLEVEAV